MNGLFGLDLPVYVNFIIAFVVVLLLIGLVAWLVRRFGSERLDAAARARQPRLAVIDSATVDSRRKLVIIRRDNVEHLLMIGGPTDVVVENNIVRNGAPVREPAGPRLSAGEPTLPRAIPLPDPTPWPLQPEPAAPVYAPAPVVAPQPHVAVEEPAHWPEQTEMEPAPAPEAPPAPRPRQRPQADTLAGLAAELGGPAKPRSAPRAAPAAAAQSQPQGDQNLTEMAQRLEAALRRPMPPGQQAPAKAAPQAQQRPAPAAEPRRPANNKAPDVKAAPRGEPPAKFESIEQEMASLLSRPAGKT